MVAESASLRDEYAFIRTASESNMSVKVGVYCYCWFLGGWVEVGVWGVHNHLMCHVEGDISGDLMLKV